MAAKRSTTREFACNDPAQREAMRGRHRYLDRLECIEDLDANHCMDACCSERYGGAMDNVRLADSGDAAAVAAIYAPSVTDAAVSFELTPPSADEIAERIAKVSSHAPWLVLVRDGDIAGFAYASRHRERAGYQWSVDTSVYVRADQQRGGVGRTLYSVLLALLRVQGFYAAHAGITLPNPGSIALHEAMGFRRIGVEPSVGYKLGVWHDVGWWQVELHARTGAPAAPLSVQEAQVRRDWSEALAGPRERPPDALFIR
jgi:L-amino acid N-acyltransferase YncA